MDFMASTRGTTLWRLMSMCSTVALSSSSFEGFQFDMLTFSVLLRQSRKQGRLSLCKRTCFRGAKANNFPWRPTARAIGGIAGQKLRLGRNHEFYSRQGSMVGPFCVGRAGVADVF